jgi:hypothetical protein
MDKKKMYEVSIVGHELWKRKPIMITEHHAARDAGEAWRIFFNKQSAHLIYKSITVREVKHIEEQKERPGAAVPGADRKPGDAD